MLETLAKNLWILLTVVMPGLFTYGTWRLCLLLDPSGKPNIIHGIAGIDDSAIASASIIIAIALLQQAVAIAIESALALLAKAMKTKWPNFHALFCERFAYASAGRLDENATRIIGNFFLSMNMCIGFSLLLLYFMAYEKMPIGDWIPAGLIVLLAATLMTTIFRMVNAKWAIGECKNTIASSEGSH